MDRYSLDVELFHLLLHAGLSRRTNRPRWAARRSRGGWWKAEAFMVSSTVREPTGCTSAEAGKNQLDVVIRGEATTVVWLKAALTYAVPFVVSNLGVLTATRRSADRLE